MIKHSQRSCLLALFLCHFSAGAPPRIAFDSGSESDTSGISSKRPWDSPTGPLHSIFSSSDLSIDTSSEYSPTSLSSSSPTWRDADAQGVVFDKVSCWPYREWVMNVLDDASSILLAGKVAAESPRSKPFVHFQDPRAAAAAHTLFNRAFFSLPIAQQGPHIEVFCGEPVGTSKKCGVTKSDNNVWAYSNLKPSATAGGERAWDVILCPSTFKLPRSPLPCSKPITGFTPGTTSSAWALVTQLLYIYQSILDPDIPSGQLMGGFKDTAAACVDVRRFTGGSPSTTELTKAGRGLSPIQRAVCLARVAAWSADLGLVEDPDRYTGPPCLQNFFSGNFDDSELPRYMKASTY